MFINEASQFWKMASNWVYFAIAVLTAVQEQWVPVFSNVMPEQWYPYVVAVLAVLGVFVRLLNQGIKAEGAVIDENANYNRLL